jgi:hypothetical protein
MLLERNLNSVNRKLFASTPTIKIKLQTEAYNWTRTKPIIKFRTIDGMKYCFIQSHNQQGLKEADINKFLKHRAKMN